VPKTFTDDEAEYMTLSATHRWLSIDCWTRELRSDKNSYRRLCSVDRTVGDAPSNILFVPACNMDEYAEEKRTEKNLIVRSGISEAETTNNKRLCSMFCIEAIQTRSIARPLRQQSFWLFVTSERIYKIKRFLAGINYIEQQVTRCQFYLNESVTRTLDSATSVITYDTG